MDVLTFPKHCTSMKRRTFTLRFHHSNLGNAGKRPFYTYLKSEDCNLNHYLPIVDIFAIIWEFTTSNSNAFIFKNENFLKTFHSLFWIYIKFATFWKKSWDLELKYFWNYSLRKTWMLESIGVLVLEHPRAVNFFTCPNIPFYVFNILA